MAEVRAYECEECGDLGKAGDGGEPPEGWLYVTTQIIEDGGADVQGPHVFCSAKCRGYFFRPMRRRSSSAPV